MRVATGEDPAVHLDPGVLGDLSPLNFRLRLEPEFPRKLAFWFESVGGAAQGLPGSGSRTLEACRAMPAMPGVGAW